MTWIYMSSKWASIRKILITKITGKSNHIMGNLAVSVEIALSVSSVITIWTLNMFLNVIFYFFKGKLIYVDFRILQGDIWPLVLVLFFCWLRSCFCCLRNVILDGKSKAWSVWHRGDTSLVNLWFCLWCCSYIWSNVSLHHFYIAISCLSTDSDFTSGIVFSIVGATDFLATTTDSCFTAKVDMSTSGYTGSRPLRVANVRPDSSLIVELFKSNVCNQN